MRKFRKTISKKLRFNIFKRDDFICQYCGRTPPTVTLELDHIDPVCNGGDNKEDNLLTACFDCNRGKSGESLSAIPLSVAEKNKILIEKEAQIKEYNKTLRSKKARETRTINELENYFVDWFETIGVYGCFTDSFKDSIRTNFLPHLTEEQLVTALIKALNKVDDPDASLKYFCGVCWRAIKGTYRYGSL